MSASLESLYGGWGDHNALLIGALTGLDADQLSHRPAEGLWPVRMLASHIIANRAWWFFAWMGEGADVLPRFVDFDEGPEAETHSADELVAGLGATWTSVRAALERWSDGGLDERFQRPTPNLEGERPGGRAGTSSGTWWSTTCTTEGRSR